MGNWFHLQGVRCRRSLVYDDDDFCNALHEILIRSTREMTIKSKLFSWDRVKNKNGILNGDQAFLSIETKFLRAKGVARCICEN